MRTVALMLLLATAPAARAADWTWRPINTAGEAAWAALVFVDWAQTRQPGFKEMGPFKPLITDSAGRVDETKLTAWSFASLAIHAGISAALPRPYREFWQMTTVAVEAGNVGMNFKCGARVAF